MPDSIFQNIVQPQGSAEEVSKAQTLLKDAREGIASAVPIAQAVYQTLNLLPEGELKSWLMANPVEFWKKIVQLFTGRKYTTGDYILGERYIDQVMCKGDVTRRQVPDEIVPIAQTFFTIVFGVRIHTEEDLAALDNGVQAYRSRWTSKGVPDNAIERAVFLKTHFYQAFKNNQACWDLSYFEKYPLVAPIPGHDVGTLYTGPLPGGAHAIDGIIPVEAGAILRQLPTGTPFDPATVVEPVNNNPAGGSDPLAMLTGDPLVLGLLVVGAVLVVNEID